MSTKQLNNLREKQEQEQDEVIDELITNVKNLKQGGKAINE
jgi:archaellum component FlaC